MIKDFWTTNLNPLTMQPREIMSRSTDFEGPQNELRYTTKNLYIDKKYISQSEAMEILKLGAKKIKSYIENLGIEIEISIYDKKRFYKICDVEAIQAAQASKKEDVNLWISSKELRKELGLNNMQIWTLATKLKWKKKKLNGNVNYFLRSEVLI